MNLDSKAVLQQIDSALAFRTDHRARSKYDDLSDLGDAVLSEIVVVLADAVTRFAPIGTQYRNAAEELSRTLGMSQLHQQQQILFGILQALRRAYAENYLQSVQELIHSDLFADFFELSEGYKDPAAVVAGSILEEKIRNLCSKNNVSTTQPDGKPKKASSMNDDLAKIGVYGKLEQKNVTAWLDLRNKAAHGEYATYDKKQVEYMMLGIRDFLGRFPA